VFNNEEDSSLQASELEGRTGKDTASQEDTAFRLRNTPGLLSFPRGEEGYYCKLTGDGSNALIWSAICQQKEEDDSEMKDLWQRFVLHVNVHPFMISGHDIRCWWEKHEDCAEAEAANARRWDEIVILPKVIHYNEYIHVLNSKYIISAVIKVSDSSVLLQWCQMISLRLSYSTVTQN